jgi:cytochrome P450
MLRALPAALTFTHYLRKLIGRRHAEPEDDLLTALVRAEMERIGGEVTRFRGGIR